jgi:hypothetical protein
MLTFGCVKAERKLLDKNTFYSSKNPRLHIKVSKEFKFLGKADATIYRDYTTSPGGTFHKNEAYIFGHIDNHSLQSAVIISFSTMRKGYYLPDVFSKIKNKIDRGSLRIGDKRFHFCVYASSSPLVSYQETFLDDEGYVIPNCFLVKAYCRRTSIRNEDDTRVTILYLEDIFHRTGYRCKDWKNVNAFEKEQSEFLTEFVKRSEQSIQFLEDITAIK